MRDKSMLEEERLGNAPLSCCLGAGPAFPHFSPRGCPLLLRLLRQGGDSDLHELRMPSQVPRPVPAKNAGARMGQPLDLRFYFPARPLGRRVIWIGAVSSSSN